MIDPTTARQRHGELMKHFALGDGIAYVPHNDLPEQPPVQEDPPMADDRYARRTELMKLPKHKLVEMARRYWGGGALPPEKWTKEELAGDIADFEEGTEKYEAYGKVGLFNGRPMTGTRPCCGGTNCPGHSLPSRPWEEVRARYRNQQPCIGPLPEPAGPAEGRVRFLADHQAPAFDTPHTTMRFRAGDDHRVYRWRRPDETVDETVWWTAPQDEARFAFQIPDDVVEVIHG